LLTEYPDTKGVTDLTIDRSLFVQARRSEPHPGFSIYGSEDEAPCFPRGMEADKNSPKQPQQGLSLFDHQDEAPCFPRGQEPKKDVYELSNTVMRSMLRIGSDDGLEDSDKPEDTEKKDVVKAKLLGEVITNIKSDPDFMTPVIEDEPLPFADDLTLLKDHYMGAKPKDDNEEIEELNVEDRLFKHHIGFNPPNRSKGQALWVILRESTPNDGFLDTISVPTLDDLVEKLKEKHNARNGLKFLNPVVEDEPFHFGPGLVEDASDHLHEGYKENASTILTKWAHSEEKRTNLYRGYRSRKAAVEAQMLPRSLRNKGKGKEVAQIKLLEEPEEQIPVKAEEELAREAEEKKAREAAAAIRRHKKKLRQKERREIAKQEKARQQILIEQENAQKEDERLAKSKAEEEADKNAEEEKRKASPKKFTPFKVAFNPPSESNAAVVAVPPTAKELPKKTLVLRPIQPALPVTKAFAQRPNAVIPEGAGKKASRFLNPSPQDSD
jgi:hypothetical protein